MARLAVPANVAASPGAPISCLVSQPEPSVFRYRRQSRLYRVLLAGLVGGSGASSERLGRSKEPVKVLLVADNRKIESFVWAALCQRWWGRVTLDWKKTLSQALDTAKTDFFDAILV